MKKSLVLAMAMALGVTASAYAANPFSDVPAGHWAYDSVNKLAAAGIVDGYGNGTFGGDRLMTRYEMAQIVAKAMAKGANVDRLAAEFADELDSLGVRVAALEKKSDNVKITGQVRFSYKDADASKGIKEGDTGRLRTRLFVKGSVNEDWTYTGRFENNQYTNDNVGNDDVKLNWAFVSGRVGGIKMDAGRMDFTNAGGTVLDSRGDGVKLSYGDKIKVHGWAMKGVDDLNDASVGAKDNADVYKSLFTRGMDNGDRVYVVGVSGQLGIVDAAVNYYKVDTEADSEIYEVAAGVKLAKDLKLNAAYYNGDIDGVHGLDDSGYLVGLSYAGAKAAKVGSWGLYANYSDRPVSTYLSPTMLTGYATAPYVNGHDTVGALEADGYKGFEVGANYTLAKNIVAGIKYFDLDAREGDGNAKTLWSEVVFTF